MFPIVLEFHEALTLAGGIVSGFLVMLFVGARIGQNWALRRCEGALRGRRGGRIGGPENRSQQPLCPFVRKLFEVATEEEFRARYGLSNRTELDG